MAAVEPSTASDPDIAPALPGSPIARALTPWLGFILAIVGLVWASGLVVDFGVTLIAEQVMCAVLGHALAIVYLNAPGKLGTKRGRLPWYDAMFALIGLCVGWYLFFRFPFLLQNVFYVPVEANLVGGAIVLLTAEGLRRTAGWGIFSVLLVFAVYGLFGHLIPGSLQGRSLDPLKFFSFLGIDQTGLLGLPLNIISTIVVIFIFLGQALLRSGGSSFITDISAAAMGNSRGGSAKIAVVASGLFGSISGSAVSNVASTGVLTIPLMRKGGYTAPVAGAIEAVASTGGQIMPPIMGVAAFLMAELLEIEYREVIIAALLPALLYYISVFLQADLEAGRLGIAPIPKDQIPPAMRVLKEGWYFIVPFVVLLFALFSLNAPPEKAALYGAIAIVILGLIFRYRGHRLTFASVMECFKKAGEAAADIVIIGGAAGIILGILDATGLAFALTLILVEVGENSLILLLILTAVVSIILGMGMPTTA
ncbi:MAG: TRAP transporter fused permease subunit, partial [Proteobacteria bacterium]|nr:TRAP transporter fused permease subunit [Pseudomonadota bacterium]